MVQATGRATTFASVPATFERASCALKLLARVRGGLSLPIGVVRFGAGYCLVGEMGELIGQIVSVDRRPSFGHNEPTVYLRR